MFLDILAVYVVTLVSSLFLCTTSVHGLPPSAAALQLIRSHPSADFSPSLRLSRHAPVPRVDYDLGGDISEMLIGESNELPTPDDDASPFTSSLDVSNEPFQIYSHPLSRKLFLSSQNEDERRQQQQQKQQKQQKRSTPTPLLPAQFNFNPAVAATNFADPSHANSVVNFDQLSEAGRLSPSLKHLIERNQLARAWLTMLLQKVMEEQQPVPYIFKYGRRRKK